MIKIERICAIYFSPTGTTEKIVKTISSELVSIFKTNPFSEYSQDHSIESFNHDFTLPSARTFFPRLCSSDLVVFGMPTYAGRLPNLMLPYLDTILGSDAIAIPVVTFGNRSFDNSLIELCNILELHGFHTIAGGAFACEHSFSYELGAGRPDEADLEFAKKFAELIYSKIKTLDKTRQPLLKIKVDGHIDAGYYQPRDHNGVFIDIRKVKPMTRDKCINCGLCATSCSMGAIDLNDFSNIKGKCIKCCSCYKKCPVGAKYFDDKDYLYHKGELEAMYGSRRAENKIFI